ncbi:YoaK family protein [Nocardioides sp. CN2-186]|uniref:YoaK family protein n=1 Tax=Nocardioides tweenelious TaxID=3156607 RepID=UPI0032B5D297
MHQLREAWHLIVPAADDPHGPLAPILLLLTFVTGLVDAFSYLLLGHVLVANMTGNVVFLGFAFAGAPGFLWWASLLAIGTFLAGALVGGRLGLARGSHRGRHLLWATGAETVLVGTALALSLVLDRPYGNGSVVTFVTVLGIALGIQNASARKLAVPDLTTTVLTLMITGIASDSKAAGGSGSKIGRRVVPIVTMLLGGFVGAVLTVRGHGSVDLGIVTAVLAAAAGAAALTARSHAPWTSPR